MLELRLAPSAQRDIDDIWEYTREQWSVTQANRYVAQLREDIDSLRRRPTLGRPIDHPAGVSKRTSGSHIIVYRWNADRLDVIRILHARMDLLAHLPANET